MLQNHNLETRIRIGSLNLPWRLNRRLWRMRLSRVTKVSVSSVRFHQCTLSRERRESIDDSTIWSGQEKREKEWRRKIKIKRVKRRERSKIGIRLYPLWQRHSFFVFDPFVRSSNCSYTRIRHMALSSPSVHISDFEENLFHALLLICTNG